MSDHDGIWPDHHDDPSFGHDPLDQGELFGQPHEPLDFGDQHEDLWHHDLDPPEPHDLPDHDDAGHDAGHDPDPHPVAEVHELGTVGADPDALGETDAVMEVFPPAVDVGALPEPVDGFPWIDTGSLGLVDPSAGHLPTGSPEPSELADYAAEELPPGVDPWAALADSDDPATSALARFWGQPS
jgi:hypothetical protein